jgi:hypothetical protein
MAQYKAMRESFVARGFTEAYADFRIIDNTEKTQKDAYEAYEYFRATSTAKYLLMMHQDVLATSDTYSVLSEKLQELEALDPRWAIAGNAGKKDMWISGPIHIAEPSGVHVDSSFSYPARVSSLDENFLIFNLRNSFKKLSVGNGFHFYGTVLPLSAESEGFRSYVIQFLVNHLSKGKMNSSFFDAKQSIEDSGVFSSLKPIQPTTCTVFCFSGSKRDKSLAYARSLLMLLHDYSAHQGAVEELWARKPCGFFRCSCALIQASIELVSFHASSLSFKDTCLVLRSCIAARKSPTNRAFLATLCNILLQQSGAQRHLSLLMIGVFLGINIRNQVGSTLRDFMRTHTISPQQGIDCAVASDR